MANIPFIVAIFLAFALHISHAAIVEHTFNVQNMTITRLCESRIITAINGRMPGPTIEAREGDTVIVHVTNQSPYNITIHWAIVIFHFNITGQEGTLWWHAHVSYLRATVYGALIIHPRNLEEDYPFPKPDKEEIILLGEWWNANVVDVGKEAALTGSGTFNMTDAYTINGKPGDTYNCSTNDMYKISVESGKTYLLRIINAALNVQFFFKIAGHIFTVVAADASYTNPYKTDTIVLAPGQTIDALITNNAPPGLYYMVASPFISFTSLFTRVPFNNIVAHGIVQYGSDMSTSHIHLKPLMPDMPIANDTETAYKFYTNLTGLVMSNNKPTVPKRVDERMFVSYGMGLTPCRPDQTKCNKTYGTIAGSMNNVSFELPTKISLLESSFRNESGIYTKDFPNEPANYFDFTNETAVPNNYTIKGMKVKRVKYNSTLEIVLQNMAIFGLQYHPIHLHGFNFYVLAQGLGNYNKSCAVKKYNLVDPHVRNTIAVPGGGWAVIRFVADNPGIWIMHCHLEKHMVLGLGMAFEVENGATSDAILPPPPQDHPKC